MRGSVDFKQLSLSPSEQGVFRKWSRVIALIYAGLALAGIAAAVATSGQQPQTKSMTAQQAPAFIIVDFN